MFSIVLGYLQIFDRSCLNSVSEPSRLLTVKTLSLDFRNNNNKKTQI